MSRRRRTPGARSRSSGRSPRRRRSSTSTRSRRWSAARTSTACAVPGTRSSRERRPRSRASPRRRRSSCRELARARSPRPRARQRDRRRPLADSRRSRGARPRGPSGSPCSRPQNNPRAGYVVYDDERPLGRRAPPPTHARPAPREGIAARGAVVDPDPLQAAPGRARGVPAGRDHHLDAPGGPVGLAAREPDRPRAQGRRRHPGRARRRRPGGNARACARPRDRESDRRRASRSSRPFASGRPSRRSEFTVVVPADPPGAEERMKRSLALLRGAGVEATGHVGDPDPSRRP